MESPIPNSTIIFPELTLNIVDFSLFGSSIALSLIIGLYFGFFSKQNSTKEYLFGGKTMGYIPVATSMLAGLVVTYFNCFALPYLSHYNIFIPVIYGVSHINIFIAS